MIFVRIPDIGDGLSGAIYTHTGRTIQIDCGSQQNAVAAFEKGMNRVNPNYFILSHFHTDHYNGLFVGVRDKRKFDIEKAIIPIIPKFPERKEFIHCLMAINTRVLGGRSGSMDYDFLTVMNQLSCNNIAYRRVKKGDEVVLGGEHFQVLWPPAVLSDRGILVSVKKALDAFNKAKSEDEVLKKIYEELEDSSVLRAYLVNDDPEEININRENDHIQWLDIERNNIPTITKNANEALRGVANRLSLAFRADSQLLFLGDMEANEINQVVEDLENDLRLRFAVLLTPHHGTHWGHGMGKLRIAVAISSVGDKLFKHVKPDYKNIARRHLLTHIEGEVLFPSDFYFNNYLEPWWLW